MDRNDCIDLHLTRRRILTAVLCCVVAPIISSRSARDEVCDQVMTYEGWILRRNDLQLKAIVRA
jgi:hypothetical protein